MSTHLETIQLRIDHRAAWITLDRPPLNVLDIAMMESLVIFAFIIAILLLGKV